MASMARKSLWWIGLYSAVTFLVRPKFARTSLQHSAVTVNAVYVMLSAACCEDATLTLCSSQGQVEIQMNTPVVVVRQFWPFTVLCA
jgi:hypothetical protein